MHPLRGWHLSSHLSPGICCSARVQAAGGNQRSPLEKIWAKTREKKKSWDLARSCTSFHEKSNVAIQAVCAGEFPGLSRGQQCCQYPPNFRQSPDQAWSPAHGSSGSSLPAAGSQPPRELPASRCSRDIFIAISLVFNFLCFRISDGAIKTARREACVCSVIRPAVTVCLEVVLEQGLGTAARLPALFSFSKMLTESPTRRDTRTHPETPPHTQSHTHPYGNTHINTDVGRHGDV